MDAEVDKLPMAGIVSLFVCSGCNTPNLIRWWGMQADLSLPKIGKDTNFYQRTQNMMGEQKRQKKSSGTEANAVSGRGGKRGNRGGFRSKGRGGGNQGKGGQQSGQNISGQQPPEYSQQAF